MIRNVFTCMHPVTRSMKNRSSFLQSFFFLSDIFICLVVAALLDCIVHKQKTGPVKKENNTLLVLSPNCTKFFKPALIGQRAVRRGHGQLWRLIT
jgi:hypothetical protein